MILSIAHAAVDDPSAEYIFGAWSDIVVGERPQGLMDCYLTSAEGVVNMVSVWETADDHDRALEDKGNHPSYGFFEACGLDPIRDTYEVIGRLVSR